MVYIEVDSEWVILGNSSYAIRYSLPKGKIRDHNCYIVYVICVHIPYFVNFEYYKFRYIISYALDHSKKVYIDSLHISKRWL